MRDVRAHPDAHSVGRKVCRGQTVATRSEVRRKAACESRTETDQKVRAASAWQSCPAAHAWPGQCHTDVVSQPDDTPAGARRATHCATHDAESRESNRSRTTDHTATREEDACETNLSCSAQSADAFADVSAITRTRP